MVVVHGNVTGIKKVGEQLRQLLEFVPDAMVIVDKDGMIVLVNSQAEKLFGYSREELLGEPVETLVPERFRSAHTGYRAGYIAKPRPRHLGSGLDLYGLRKDGSEFPADIALSSLETEEGVLVSSAIRDITERKKAEQQILDDQGQLRALTLELSLAEERERRQISVGLHDQIGQNLAMVKIKIGELQGSEPSSGSTRCLEEIRELIDQTMRATRSLMFDLSSPVLYELGFEAALRNLGDRLERENGIRFHLEADLQTEPLPQETSVILYRITQELVHNVVKHAEAREVRMSVGRVHDQIKISVEDDGMGFDASGVAQGFSAAGRFGLFSIREQLKHLGGRLEIESAIGKGTRVVVVVPLSS